MFQSKIVLSISTALLFSALAHASQQVSTIEQLRDAFSKEHGLTPLDATTKEEVDTALTVCNITEPIIILQDEHSTNSACYQLGQETKNPIKVMAIGVADKQGRASQYYICHSILHELGHLVAGDLENIPTAIPFYREYVLRKLECNADIFAIKKLMALNDYYTIAYAFLDFTYHCDAGKSNCADEYWLIHDHPGYRERAQIILDQLRAAKVDLKNLPIDASKHADKDAMQQKFIQQITKYFPEYLKSE